MSNFTGMDIAGVRQLSQLLNSKADEIDQIRSQLTSSLNGTQWVGNDRNQFTNDWQGQYTNALNTVVQGLRDASQRASRNADEQETASAS
ncbi:MAG: WXG100 family type VII secretion target [Ilumatobacteraceae bacterium]